MFLRVQRYIFIQLLVGLVFAVGGMLFISLPAITVAAVHKLPGVPMVMILRFIPIVLLGLVPYVLPLGYLLALVSTYGRLAADNEWTAMLMGRIRPLRLLVPPALIAAALSVVTFWLVSTELPALREREQSFKVSALREALLRLDPGRLELDLQDFFLSAGYRDKEDPYLFQDVFICVPSSDGGETQPLFADSVRFEFTETHMFVNMQNARMIWPGQSFSTRNPRVAVDLDLIAGRKKLKFNRTRYMSNKEMYAELKTGNPDPARRQSLLYEIQYRWSYAASFGVFLLIGVATGLLLRKGTQLGALAAAVGYALGYYILALRLGKILGQDGLLPPGIAAWMTDALGLVIGLFLIVRAFKR